MDLSSIMKAILEVPETPSGGSHLKQWLAAVDPPEGASAAEPEPSTPESLKMLKINALWREKREFQILDTKLMKRMMRYFKAEEIGYLQHVINFQQQCHELQRKVHALKFNHMGSSPQFASEFDQLLRTVVEKTREAEHQLREFDETYRQQKSEMWQEYHELREQLLEEFHTNIRMAEESEP